MVVNFRQKGPIGIVTIDNPPVNALSQAVRAGLLDAFKQTEALETIEAVLLICAGRTFIAGADISEFGKPLEAPHLSDLINEIEKASKPWIAVLHGNVLGGGLEVALGCHYRIAHSTTKLGLPEVTLGLIPGAGGTVRLPRLIGAVTALEMITSGKPLPARKALDIGLIDKLSTENIEEVAFEFVFGCILKPLPKPIIDRNLSKTVDKNEWASKVENVLKNLPGQNAPLAAVRSIENNLFLTPLAALAIEKKIFLEQMTDLQSKALQYIFFAERSSGQLSELKGIKPRPLNQIGIVGFNELSSEIAAACLISGLYLMIIEPDKKEETHARKIIAAKLFAAKEDNFMTDSEINIILDRLKFGKNYGELFNMDFVIDAVCETSNLKHEIISILEEVIRPDAIIARLTPKVDFNIFPEQIKDPSRLIIFNFLSLCHNIKLLELIITTSASPDVLATGFSFGKKIQKITVPVLFEGGPIGTKIISGCLSECYNMIGSGTLPWEIDKALRSFGFSIGIFEMEDFLGLDRFDMTKECQNVKKSLLFHPLELARVLCANGRLGRKSGKGWYDYSSGNAQPDKFVEELILEGLGLDPKNRKVMLDEEIISQALISMKATGLKLLSQGSAKRASDIDVVMVNGYGFPRYRGGPMFFENHFVPQC